MDILNEIQKLYADLPKFDDGRINYTGATRAAVLTVFVEAEGKLLLLKRSDKVGNYQNTWHVVGGYLDELGSIEDKIFEELHEELGIGKAEITSLKLGPVVERFDEHLGTTWIIQLAGVKLKEVQPVMLDFEHTEYRWIPPAELGTYKTLPELQANYQLFLSHE